MIVDDEKPIRQWFSFCIRESGNAGYQIVGEASNGRDALEIFRQQLPDIVITDIKMPIMDGIELLKQIKSIKPDTDVVILTCFAEFEYARQAVKEGAVEYMLKAEILDKDIMNLLDRLSENRKKRGLNNMEIDEFIQLRRNTQMYDILKKQNIELKPDKEKMKELGFVLDEDNVFALSVHTEMGSNIVETEKVIKSILMEYAENISSFKLEGEKLLFFCNLQGSPSMLMQISKLQTLASKIYSRFKYSIGVSSVHKGMDSFATAGREAVFALQYEFFKGRSNITFFSSIEKKEDRTVELNNAQKEIFEVVDRMDACNIENKVAAFFDILEKAYVKDIDDIFEMCTRLMHVLITRICFYSTSTGMEIYKITHEIKNKRYFHELRNWMIETVNNLMNTHKRNFNQYPSIIKKALEHIESNYLEPLTLNEVSSHVHLNPNYFSKLFKEVTGENYSIYIITLRLKKAEELLKSNDYKISQIAEMVGYPNLSYFSRMFKKYLGKSPFEYRNS